MDNVLGLKCTICGAEYGAGEVDYVCPRHGDAGILDVVYDYARIRRRLTPSQLANQQASIWRYLPLLPVDPAIRPPANASRSVIAMLARPIATDTRPPRSTIVNRSLPWASVPTRSWPSRRPGVRDNDPITLRTCRPRVD